eukprot:TRINITY_DN3247_c1_g1_i7.p1 TRINITY_DN3247_c1_g1~~TRINITY_DN3247_c1_g1_i7.p1  ORF type:complete len:224 (-),score=48.45 TRINITY_DN3247_c1_g1_i7:188-859(-)
MMESHRKIYFYAPNIIGFARIILAFACFFTLKTSPAVSGLLYFCSFSLDALDGYFARKFDQSTRFGAVLDMITDRFGTSCLLICLASYYPKYTIFFQTEVALDICSHYAHMYATLLEGKESHKKLDKSKNFILRLYYESRLFLGYLCLCNDLFFLFLYLTITQAKIFTYLCIFTAPFMFVKQSINVVQLISAFESLTKYDLKQRLERKETNKSEPLENKSKDE